MDGARPKLSDYGLLTLIAVIFGGSFVLINLALVSIPAATIVAGRLGMAVIIFLAVMWAVGQSLPRSPRIWFNVTASAIFGNALPFFLITWGQKSVDAGLAAILFAVMPLMTIFLAHFFTVDEKLNRYKLLGFLFGLGGVVVLIGFDNLSAIGNQALGQFAILAGALCYAINVIILKSLAGLPRYGTLAAVLLVSFLLTLPLALLYDMPWQLQFTSSSLVALIILGIIATAFGNYLRFEIVDRQGATFLAQNNYMMPLFGVFWAWVILSEQPPLNALFAMVLILAGVAIARFGNKMSRAK